MSDGRLPPRPRQLILQAGAVIGGSLFLIASVFDSLANLQSVDTREQLQEVLGSAAGRDLGVSTDQATAVLRVGISTAGVCAAIAFVLGIFVLQRHRGARVALTVVAVPLLLTAPLVGGFLGALVAVAALLLWSGPSGDWYAGRPIREPARPERRPEQRPEQRPDPGVDDTTDQRTDQPTDVQSPPPSSTRITSDPPRATQGFGQTPDPWTARPEPPPEDEPHAQLPQSQPVGQPGPWASAPARAVASGRPPGAVSGRLAGPPPPAVRLACLVAGVFSGIVTLLYLAAVAALVVDPDAIVARVVDAPAWTDTGLNRDVLVPILWLGVLIFLIWSLGAVVLAWLVWRRHDWARYLLAVSAGLVLVVGIVAFPLGLPHQIASVVTLAALFSAPARAWFKG